MSESELASAIATLCSGATADTHAEPIRGFCLFALTLLRDHAIRAHRVVISVPEQKMAVLEKGDPIATYPVSTSKFGLGDYRGSWGTPLGKLEVASKIGDAAPLGAVFKDRRFTGEVIPIDAPGRDPIVTRILWLRGRELAKSERLRVASFTFTARRKSGTSDCPSAMAAFACARAMSFNFTTSSVSEPRSRSSIPRCTR